MADGIELKMKGIDGVLRTLQELPAELVSKGGGPVRAALRKGALVILKQEKANLLTVISNATASGKKESTGFLLKNLIVSRGKKPTGGNGERYLVRVKRKVYPGRGKVSTLKTAQLLEYGSAHQPAESYIRTAFAQKKEAAVEVVGVELVKGVDRIVRKLAAQNKD